MVIFCYITMKYQFLDFLLYFYSNFMLVCLGYAMAWTAPVIPLLRSAASSPLSDVPSTDEVAWMGSIFSIGSLCGPFFGGAAASKFGRKWGLMFACVPVLLGWILAVVAIDISYLYAARFLWGFATSWTFPVTTMYCAEIATDDVRGALCSMLQVSMTVGCLLVYLVGAYFSYWGIAYVGIACVVIFATIFFFMPETPTYHLLKNNREAAASCLCTLRGRPRAAVEAELKKIEVDVNNSMKKPAAFREVFRGSNLKALYICCALLLCQEFSGIGAVVFYMTNIFQDSGIHLDPGVATIVVGVVQVFAASVTVFVVDRLGRRPLLLFSCCGTAISLILLGTFFLLVENGSEVVTKISFLPVLCLVMFMLTYCWGLGALPWTLVGELFSIEVKATASPITTLSASLTGFLVTRFFEPLALALGMYAAFWTFAAFCVMGFFFTYFLVPETKGKSFQEIQDTLAGRKSLETEKSQAKLQF